MGNCWFFLCVSASLRDQLLKTPSSRRDAEIAEKSKYQIIEHEPFLFSIPSSFSQPSPRPLDSSSGLRPTSIPESFTIAVLSYGGHKP